MTKYKLESMKKGWFVGDFFPTVLKTQDCEVAIKHYKKGDLEQAHFHKIATEITAIIHGQVKMCDQILTSGDIIVLEPETVTNFEALTDAITVVVKHPGATNDKYQV